MKELIDILFCLVGVIASIITITHAINWLIRKKDKKISFKKVNVTKIVTVDREEIDNLTTLIGDMKVESNISITYYKIFNNGRETIYEHHMALPLEIMAENNETEILDANITEVSEVTNKFSITKLNKKLIQLYFDYIDKKQWIMLRVVHTGYSRNIRIKGKIKECGIIDDISHRRNTKIPEDKINLWFYILIIIFVLSIVIGVLCKYIFKEEYHIYIYLMVSILMLLCEISFLILMFFVYKNTWIEIKESWENGHFRKKFRKNKQKKRISKN
ncbi:MAG: hypothetical protein J6M43_01710 [Neisseriaceae bacterium]|nr:hypothetical protein [Neisseriaceae bacterium]